MNLVIVSFPSYFYTLSVLPLILRLARDRESQYTFILLAKKKSAFSDFIATALEECGEVNLAGSCYLHQTGYLESLIGCVKPSRIYFTCLGVGFVGTTAATDRYLYLKSLTPCNNLQIYPIICSEFMFLTGAWMRDEHKDMVKGGTLSANVFVDDRAVKLASKFNLSIISPSFRDLVKARKLLACHARIKPLLNNQINANDAVLLTPRPWGGVNWKNNLYACQGGYEAVANAMFELISRRNPSCSTIIIKGDLRSAGDSYIKSLNDEFSMRGYKVVYTNELYTINDRFSGMHELGLGTLLAGGVLQDYGIINLFSYDSGTPIDLCSYYGSAYKAYMGIDHDLSTRLNLSKECLSRINLRCELIAACVRLVEKHELQAYPDSGPIRLKGISYDNLLQIPTVECIDAPGVYLLKRGC